MGRALRELFVAEEGGCPVTVLWMIGRNIVEEVPGNQTVAVGIPQDPRGRAMTDLID
jgi:hypothetical protein